MRPIQKIGLWFFAALLLVPGILRSAHIFADHQHFYCDHSSEQHLHKEVVDCDIFLLQQPGFVGEELFQFRVLEFQTFLEPVASAYHFLIAHYSGSTSLRGPPMVA